MSNAYQCWKSVYRLNYNWLMGQARVTSLPLVEMVKQDQVALERLGGQTPNQQSTQSSFPPIIKLKGSVVMVASPIDFIHLWRIKPSSFLQQSPTPSPPPTGTGSLFLGRTVGCDDAPQKLEYWQTYSPSFSRNSSEEASGLVSYIAWTKLLPVRRVLHSGSWSAMKQDTFLYSRIKSRAPRVGVDVKAASLREIGDTASLLAWSSLEGIQSAAFHYPILITTSTDGTISI